MSRVPRMLVVSPHPDDEVLGAGGMTARLTAAGGQVTVLTVTAQTAPLYSPEVHDRRVAEGRRAHRVLGVHRSLFWSFPTLTLHQLPVHELNNAMVKALAAIRPHILLLPYYDRHVDHRRVFEAAMVAIRPPGVGRHIHLVAAYETLSSTHWNAPHIEPNFTPNWFVDITDCIKVKLRALRCYRSQLQAHPMPRSLEATRALALFRGSAIGVAYAEAFHVVRMRGHPDLSPRPPCELRP